MTERVAISKKLRFEVFKRDSFTCQYCGKKAPDVILQCDHIVPVIDGGGNDILNLLAACVDCNSGKGARKLSDNAALTKQLDQLAELQERREQIEMMIEWRAQLSQFDDDIVQRLEERWHELIEHRATLTPTGRDTLKKLLNKYGVDLVLRAMQESCVSYLKRDKEQQYEMESINQTFGSIGRVANVLRQSETKPYLRRLFYIRGILRNRLHYMNDHVAMNLMEEAAQLDISLDWLENFAKTVRNWSSFTASLEAFIKRERGDGQNSND